MNKLLDLQNINSITILQIANIYNAITNDLCFKIQQIKDYNWLSDNLLNLAISRLDKNISTNPVFEQHFMTDLEVETENIYLKGYIDCIDDKNVWVFFYG